MEVFLRQVFLVTSLLFIAVIEAKAADASQNGVSEETLLGNHVELNEGIFLLQESQLEGDWASSFYELGGYMLIGAGLYSQEEEAMKVDWDFEVEDGFIDHVWDRFTSKDAWKFDNNDFTLNWGHVYAGMFYHQAFRNNDLSFYQSLTGPIVGSLLWEGVVEYKEVVSINDHVTTIFGGAYFGEALFQTSEMLKRKQGSFANVLAAVFNPSQTYGHWYNDRPFSSRYRNFSKEFGFMILFYRKLVLL